MKNKILIIGLVMGMLMVQLVSAFGVTTPFHSGNPLVTTPGKVEIVELLLQNMDETEDVLLRASITEGADIATLTDENPEYLVPVGVKHVRVPLRVEVPLNMKPGEKRDVGVLFSKINVNSEGKMVQLAAGIKAITPIVIASPPDQASSALGSSSLLAVALALFVLAVIGGIILSRKSKRQRRS